MKEGIHPHCPEVAFQDMTNGEVFIMRSAVNTREKTTINGKEYPLFKLDSSSASHPVYTGAKQRIVETNRVTQFLKHR
jgi:large subunit ribosomal protein L31